MGPRNSTAKPTNRTQDRSREKRAKFPCLFSKVPTILCPTPLGTGRRGWFCNSRRIVGVIFSACKASAFFSLRARTHAGEEREEEEDRCVRWLGRGEAEIGPRFCLHAQGEFRGRCVYGCIRISLFPVGLHRDASRSRAANLDKTRASKESEKDPPPRGGKTELPHRVETKNDRKSSPSSSRLKLRFKACPETLEYLQILQRYRSTRGAHRTGGKFSSKIE